MLWNELALYWSNENFRNTNSTEEERLLGLTLPKKIERASGVTLFQQIESIRHEVISKQNNDTVHRSIEVSLEKMNNKVPRPKGRPIDDSHMSEAGLNDLRYEALAGRIDKVKDYLEQIVQHITES